MGDRGVAAGPGPSGRKKPRERRHGGGRALAFVEPLARFWRKNIQTRRKNGLEIATMFARGEGSKEGKGASWRRRGGRAGWAESNRP